MSNIGMPYAGLSHRPTPPAPRSGPWRREGVVPVPLVLALLTAGQVLAVALSVAASSGHEWIAWLVAALAVCVSLASVLALASRVDGRVGGVLRVGLAIVVQAVLTVALAFAAGPALRDAYLGVVGVSEQVVVVGPVPDSDVSDRVGTLNPGARPVRLGVRTLSGGPVRGGSVVLDMLVPGDVYATYMSGITPGAPPPAWPRIRLWVDPLGIVSPLPVARDGGVARTSPLLPAGQFFAVVFAGWLALGALMPGSERRLRRVRSAESPPRRRDVR